MLENGVLFPDPGGREALGCNYPPEIPNTLSVHGRTIARASAEIYACYQRQPPHSWEHSQQRIQDSLDAVLRDRATTTSNRITASVLRTATPLFMLPNAYISVDDVSEGLTETRNGYLLTLNDINFQLKQTPSSHTETVKTLIGKGNELCILAALTSPRMMEEKGLLALPALPWEDQPGLFGLHDQKDGKCLAIDAKLVPFPNLPGAPEAETLLQIKTSHLQSKEYAQHIRLVYASIVGHQLVYELPELQSSVRNRPLFRIVLEAAPHMQGSVLEKLHDIIFRTL